MENAILDVAFELLLAREVCMDLARAYVDRDQVRIHELKRRFPGVSPEAVEAAYRSANELQDVAITLADQHRSTGAAFDCDILGARCPGFSMKSYAVAVNDGYMMTR